DCTLLAAFEKVEVRAGIAPRRRARLVALMLKSSLPPLETLKRLHQSWSLDNDTHRSLKFLLDHEGDKGFSIPSPEEVARMPKPDAIRFQNLLLLRWAREEDMEAASGKYRPWFKRKG